MKHLVTAAVLVALAAGAAQAAPIAISVPYIAEYNSVADDTETGTSFSNDFTFDGGTLTATFTSASNADQRPGDFVAAAPIYAIRMQAGTSATNDWSITFTGLDSEKDYSFDLTTWGANNVTYEYTLTAGSVNNADPAAQSWTSLDASDADDATQDFDPRYTATWSSVSPDGSGTVTFAHTGTDGSARYHTLQGVRIAVIPEPATMGLLGLGGITALRRRRR
jgi:hypothetical protein